MVYYALSSSIDQIIVHFPYHHRTLDWGFKDYDWSTKKIMMAVIQPGASNACANSVKLTHSQLTGHGTRNIKLHWKYDSGASTYTPQVYVSAFESY